MNIEIAEECSRLSDKDKITFPEVVARLAQSGIESYAANLLVPNKIYFAGNESHSIPLKLKGERKVANVFKQEGVVEALRAIQGGKIGYPEFLKRIMDAGVISYLVFIKGRMAMYLGRKGEQYIERFP